MLNPSFANDQLKTAFYEVLADCDAAGVDYGDISHVALSTTKKRLGDCRKNPDGTFTIRVTKSLLGSEIDIKHVMMHEVLHTGYDCMKHTGNWKKNANIINKVYPNKYNVERSTTLNDRIAEAVVADAPYVFKCAECGQTIVRFKNSKFVKGYQFYKCGLCGGNLVKVKG